MVIDLDHQGLIKIKMSKFKLMADLQSRENTQPQKYI